MAIMKKIILIFSLLLYTAVTFAQCKGDCENGFGKFRMNSGYEIYEGNFKNGYFFGTGKLILKDQSRRYHLYGDYKYNLTTLEGIWQNDSLLSGKKVYKNLAIEDGEYDLLTGCLLKGKKTYPNGDYTEGFYKNNSQDMNGAKYDKFKKWNKKGELIFDGYLKYGVLVANFQEEGNCNNGFGKKMNQEGNVYEGNWKNGLYDGKGKLTMGGIVIYDGEWKKGKKNGYGILQGVKNSFVFERYNVHKPYPFPFKIEGQFVNDEIGDSGITSYDDTENDANNPYEILSNNNGSLVWYRVATWKVVNNKIVGTIEYKDKRCDVTGCYLKYEGEILSKDEPFRNGTGATYNDGVLQPKRAFFKDRIASLTSEEENIKLENYQREERVAELKNICTYCKGEGQVWETWTEGGNTYTTGGETVNSQHATSSGIIEKSDGSKYIETTTTSSTYKNPTYTFTSGGVEKRGYRTCSHCGGTGKIKH